MKSKVLLLSTLIVLITMGCSTAKDCVECTKKTLGKDVQPDSKPVADLKKDVEPSLALALKGPLVITKNDRAPAGEVNSKEDYQDIFCHKFAQIEGNFVGLTIKEMEATSYSVEEFFTTPSCQPGGYSNVVKSPILHVIADDPSKRIGFLDSIWLYYLKKRKEPSKFLEVVNAKNTKGETLLDYIETMKLRGDYSSQGSQASLAQIISVACSHGAIYSTHSEKKCP